jgi:small subunit ribosomal protein S8
MGMTDPIGDMLTRIRNASKAGRKFVDVPASKLKRDVARIMAEEHYIDGFKVFEDKKQGDLRLYLKYVRNEEPIIKGIKRISMPGLRIYSSSERLPRVQNGLGIAIISTSSGVMTDRDARRKGVGGEVICFVW